MSPGILNPYRFVSLTPPPPSIGAPQLGTMVEGTAAATTRNVTYPATVNKGDIAILFAINGSTSATGVSTPAGFRSVAQLANTVNTLAPAAAMFIHTCTGAEGGTNVAVATPGNLTVTAGIIVFLDAEMDSVLTFVTDDKDTASSSFAFPDITAQAADSTVVYVAAANSNTISSSPLTGFTEAYDRNTGLSGNRSINVGYKQGISAGTVTMTGGGWGGSTRDTGVAITLRPQTTYSAALWDLPSFSIRSRYKLDDVATSPTDSGPAIINGSVTGSNHNRAQTALIADGGFAWNTTGAASYLGFAPATSGVTGSSGALWWCVPGSLTGLVGNSGGLSSNRSSLSLSNSNHDLSLRLLGTTYTLAGAGDFVNIAAANLIGLFYTSGTNLWSVYVNGQLAGTATEATTFVSAWPAFRLVSIPGSTNYATTLDDVVLGNGSVSAADQAALYAYKL